MARSSSNSSSYSTDSIYEPTPLQWQQHEQQREPPLQPQHFERVDATIIKCTWCKHRSRFLFDDPDGGTEHRFNDWITKRVQNRWQLICDKCNTRGRPPHSDYYTKHVGVFPKVVWDMIVIYTYEECNKADECSRRTTTYPILPCLRTFQEHPLSYINDSRMWSGMVCLLCLGTTNRTRVFASGLCSHIQELRRENYQRRAQIKLTRAFCTGTMTPALQSLGMVQQDVEAHMILASYHRGQLQPCGEVLTTFMMETLEDLSEDSGPEPFDWNEAEEIQRKTKRIIEEHLPKTWCLNCNRATGPDNRGRKCMRCKVSKMCVECTKFCPNNQFPTCRRCLHRLSDGTLRGLSIENFQYGSNSSSSQTRNREER